ncbi:testicular haploid expressed gene protein-like isoform X2 [Sphaerodactylus townsendi]|uniref:testicular haploid expressed gene protein-like isoform X2 n=1 Tax=Sphaerodactylus townsendi TaxID=933632 RepID=UPI002026BBA3|nr:testicular haploid expressed gene protein-like isoform X2 [Sphaerodactylus townsendi]
MASVPQLDFHMSESPAQSLLSTACCCGSIPAPPSQHSHIHRIHHLAKPKKIEDVWNFSRKLVWGNQETIWPLSPWALTGQPNKRILNLAKPKKNFGRKLHHRPLHVFSSNLESTIWEHPSDIYHTSERIRLLSEPRQYSTLYLEQRPRRSAVWPVSSSALSCKASQRLLDLSQPRNLSPSFIFPKEHKTRIKQSVRTAVASARIQRLAQPIVKKSNPCYENRYMEAPIRKVNLAALQTVATPRLVELSKAKALPPNSFPDRRAEWSVSQAAKKTVASPRLLELARCPTRASTNFVQFNPEAFTVTEAAKKARCTDRLNKLAEPILR